MWYLTSDAELFRLGLGPVFEAPPTEAPPEGGGGAGTATADPPEDGGTPGEEGGERDDETPDDDAPESFEDKLSRIEKSEDLSEFERRDSDGFEVHDLEDEDEVSEDDEPAEAAELDDDFELPDGWKRTETGKIQRPNGEFASRAEIDALRSGEPVETASTAEDAAEAEAEGEDDGPLTVSVPGREPDDEDVELPIDVEALEELGLSPTEAKERVQQLRNGYMRRQELNRHLEQIETDRAELELIEQQLQESPADFILGHVNPELQKEIARRVVVSMGEEDFGEFVDTVARYERDPVARREDKVQMTEEQLERRRQLREDYQQTTESTRQAVEIGRAVNGIIPEDWDEGKAGRFFDFALAALQDHVNTNRIERLDPADVPEVLGQVGLLDDYGLSENGGSTSGSAADRSPPPAGSDGPAGEAEIEKAKRAGEEVRERTRRRKEAAATTPAGAGSSLAGGLKAPKGLDFDEKMDWLEKKLGLK